MFSFYKAFKEFWDGISNAAWRYSALRAFQDVCVETDALSPVHGGTLESYPDRFTDGEHLSGQCSYLMGGKLVEENVSLMAVTSFIVAWVTVGIIQIPAEASILGQRFPISPLAAGESASMSPLGTVTAETLL